MLVFISLILFFLMVFLVAGIAVAIAYLAFLKKKDEQDQVARTEFTAPQTETTSEGEVGLRAETSQLLRSEQLSTITFWDDFLARFDFVEILRIRLEQSDLDWSVGRLTALMLLGGLCVSMLVSQFLPAWLGLVFGAVAAFAPYGYVVGRRGRRFDKLREQFPDMLDSLARALRAGYPLSTAMDIIAKEAVQPISGELRRTSTEANLGRGWPQALDNLAGRVPLLEVNTFIAAVQLHSRTGGRLSEVMGNLSEQMRESLALQGEIRSLAAHGKLTGAILTILPIGIAGMMLTVSPDYMRVLPEHPLGKTLIGAAVLCLILAHIIIRKIVDIRL